MDRFDKFTDRARRVLTLAQDEAQRFNHPYIGTEHLLLGLLRVEDGVATRVLRDLGVELPKVRTAVEFAIGRGAGPVVGEVGLTPRAKRVIELVIDEARRMGHHGSGTSHLLVGLVREGEGIAAGVLESPGVNHDKVRHEVIRVLAEPASADPSAAPTAVPTPLSVDDATRALGVSRWYVAIGASPLRRVVGIGQVAGDASLSVELIALEIRGAGCVLYWKAHPTPDGPLGEPQVTVSDDAGSDYEVRPAGWTGNGHELKGEILVIPGPPDEAVTMQVDLGGFAARRPAPPVVSEDVRGTWHFEFAIR